jgi:hypothetical protein
MQFLQHDAAETFFTQFFFESSESSRAVYLQQRFKLQHHEISEKKNQKPTVGILVEVQQMFEENLHNRGCRKNSERKSSWWKFFFTSR